MRSSRFAGSRFGTPAGFVGTAAFLLLQTPSALAQCALCRDAAAASSAETREALNYAIIGLAFTPYVVGALAAWMLSPALRARVRAWCRRFVPGGAGSPS
jgi:hypothetical protein